MINPSSKIALKISCLQACGNDVDKAEKLYKFVAEDIASLPDFDVQTTHKPCKELRRVLIQCSVG